MAFVSNDLLAPPPLTTTTTTMFKSNGLLGLGLPAAPESASSTGASTSSLFISNGLLGTGLLGSSTSTQITDDIEPTRPAPLFASNGLLGTRSIDSLSSQDLSQSHSQELPPVSVLLGARKNDTSSIPRHTIASITLPRLAVKANTFDGKTFYLKRKSKVLGPTIINKNPSRPIGNLLDTPIHKLMENLSTATANQLASHIPPSSNLPPQPTKAPEETLWVDRYRPHRFTELMGNERVAREVMAWVKEWDWCVFGKGKGKAKGKKRTSNGEEKNGQGWNREEDEYRRPKEKMLLLSGPPGLGKTTLAHVIAKQAGYEVMEINASDARSAQVVDDRIRPALESGSAVGSTKPVLLIIDEIDGATGGGDTSSGFVNRLISLASCRPRKKTAKNSGAANGSRPLLRPIICICNDVNASSLAKLRPHALQIRFSRPSDVHTVRRLREICEIEGLKTDGRALSTLVGVARGDLRGCLNTLQFIKSRGEEVTEPVIRAATVGMKDADGSVVSVLNSLFSPMTRKRVKELGIGEEEEAKYVARLAQEVDACGKETYVASGCFAHYATLHQHDPTFTRYEKANEWLMTYDVMNQSMYTDGDFALSGYLPYLLVPFHPLFQERGGQRVERSQVEWEHFQRTRGNEEIYSSLARCLRMASSRTGGNYRHLLRSPSLELEFAPFINRIISPPLRPVNSQVIRPEERALLSRLVEIMASIETRFVQERAEDGQLTYRLDPPIDVFITYDGKRAADIAVSRYAVRHLVAGEIDAKLITHQADAVERGETSTRSEYFKAKRAEAAEEGAASAHVNKKTKTSAILDLADKPPVDFFGRPITKASLNSTKSAMRKNLERKYRVSYRFAEGNSAAVRKPVKVDTFL